MTDDLCPAYCVPCEYVTRANMVDDLRAVIERLTAQLAEARQAERAAVVAWLNNGAHFKEHVGPGTLAMFRSMIVAIEAGEHLK